MANIRISYTFSNFKCLDRLNLYTTYSILFPNKLLLADMYNVKPDPGLSGNDAHNQYLLNPNEFACGYKQASNNKKYWDTPCDGTAYPPNICGGLYEKKH